MYRVNVKYKKIIILMEINMHFGFSYVGIIYFMMLIIPNII